MAVAEVCTAKSVGMHLHERCKGTEHVMAERRSTRASAEAEGERRAREDMEAEDARRREDEVGPIRGTPPPKVRARAARARARSRSMEI